MDAVCRVLARRSNMCDFFVSDEVFSQSFTWSSFGGVCKEWSFDPARMTSTMIDTTVLTQATYDRISETCASACECTLRKVHDVWTLFFFLSVIGVVAVFVAMFEHRVMASIGDRVRRRDDGPQTACASNKEKLMHV